jgi:endo-1,3-1,4-beta-glycanase ExoK
MRAAGFLLLQRSGRDGTLCCDATSGALAFDVGLRATDRDDLTPGADGLSRFERKSGGVEVVMRTAPIVLSVVLSGFSGMSLAQDAPASSFHDDFDTFDRSRWYVADGWANGEHQNCVWSKDQLSLKDGVLTLSFEKRPGKDRDYSCAEVQTHKRFGYGLYEARLKTDKGSGINAAFFSYIGPADGKPHDEIDFEILTRNTSKVDVNTYVSGKPRNGSSVAVEGGTDTGFNDYAFLWEKDRLRWYVNGKLMHEARAPAELPKEQQKIFFSLWGSDTLADWMGPFEDPGRKITMQIDRVAYTAPGDKCQFPESLACKLN